MGVYGGFYYGQTYYGVSPLPTSMIWDVFDFCEPNEAMMVSLLSYSEVVPVRYAGGYTWFNVDSDYCMMSDDENDSGFRINIVVPNRTFSLQFSILPTSLPEDFSSLSTSRVFISVFNNFGYSVGLLLSENDGIALSNSGTGSYTIFTDSADIFSEGLDYYVFRVTVNEDDERANLYVTRKDVLAATGVHELRYTFTPLDCPSYELDNVRVEVVGSATEPTQVCLDCIRLSSSEVITNRRPVAVISDDQARLLGQYGYLDGRSSYDPDTPPAPLTYWWTVTNAPSGSLFWKTGEGTTPVDPTGYTNIITGSSGTFGSLLEGDLVVGDIGNSPIMRVASDGSWIALTNDVMVANSSLVWRALVQSTWGGVRITKTEMIDVLERRNTPPGSPATGSKYLIIATATGDWTGHEGEIATYDGGWSYELLSTGKMVFVLDEYEAYRTAGSGIWSISDPKPWELDHYEGRTAAIGVLLPDVIGLYTTELLVNDSVRDSLPTEALINIYENQVPLGCTPDLSFVWNYLSNFWSLVEGREKIETIWSGSAQLCADELMKLWQNDYSKSLFDIQRTFQRRWQKYSLWYEEPSYVDLPAIINTAVDSSGYATAPEPGAGIASDRVYVTDTGTLPFGITENNHLILNGIGYKISRINNDNIITFDTLPDTLSKNWMIRPFVKSQQSNFSSLGVCYGDAAVFEVSTTDGEIIEIRTFVWGARGSYLFFDDSSLTTYLNDSTYTVLFRGIYRRTTMAIDDLITNIPKLQEVIALQRIDDAPDPLYEGHNFRIENTVTAENATINIVNFIFSWFESKANGFFGYTDASSHEFFYDASTDFEALFGAGSDLTNYVLELDGAIYRLKQVISATKIELFDKSLELNLSGQRWHIRELILPPDDLWAELTYFDNRPAIESRFGRLMGFTLDHLAERTDDLDYLSAVQGLWSYVWHGRTLERTRISSQIILGLPFADIEGTITDIQSPFDSTRSRILIQDNENEAIIRSYFYPTTLGIAVNPNTGVTYVLGDQVGLFAPLSRGVSVVDYISDSTWFEVYLGSGDLCEVQKCHTFGILIHSSAFNLTNLIFLNEFLRKYRPDYTYPLFVVINEISHVIDISDPTLLGPAIPIGYTYPSDWGVHIIPSSWSDNPFEVPRAAITDHYPTTPAVPPAAGRPEFGNLHLRDIPVHLPDGWSGSWPNGPGTHIPTRAEGVFCFDDTDNSGHAIHRFDSVAINMLSDGDMESADDPGDPGSPWDLANLFASGLSLTAVKSSAQTYQGTQSLHITSAGYGLGVEQVLSSLIDEDFQVGAKLYIYLISGQAYIRILDQDASQTVVAEWRHAAHQLEWHEIILYVQRVSSGSNNMVLQIVTGPGGGEFYVDEVSFSEKLMPWNQWGFDRIYLGRTGGYTDGGVPDENVELSIVINGV